MQMFFQQRVLLFTVSMTFLVCVLQISNFRSGNCRIVSECIVISLKQFSKFEYTISDLFLKKSTDNQEYSLHCIAIDLANTIS